MAQKDQRRGNRETRKPKQPKAAPPPEASPFVATRGKPGGAPSGKK